MDNEASENPESPVSARVTIPKEKYAPKPEKEESYKPKINNFADNEETVALAIGWAKGYLNDFKTQGAWEAYRDEMDIADEMTRAAKVRSGIESDQSDNVEDTRANVSTASYWQAIRTISSGEAAIIIGSEESLPVKYAPILGAVDYSEDEGRRIADHQNLLLSYTFEISKFREKLKEILFFLNKYANAVVEMFWDYRIEERVERVPTGFEENEEDGTRRPKGFKFEKKKRIIADHPDIRRYDMKDVWFDATIDDAQNQSCIIFRKQKQLGEIWQLQATNEFTNVGKIGKDQLYQGEGDGEVLDDRQENADEGSDANSPTTLFDTFTAWIRLPINDETGKWEPDKQLPHWYKMVVAGDLNGKPVCLQLSPNPNFNKKIPVAFLHSHQDDKGALHMGFSTLSKCLYAIETTLMNQMIDNNTKVNQRPWVVERGALSNRSKKFTSGGNQIYELKPGAKEPKELEVVPIAGQILPILNTVIERFRDTVGTNKPFLGEPMGGRTSASEARIVFEQAVKPALEDAKYKANQILPFVAEWCMEMWREFGDPNRRIIITRENEQYEVKPTELWGPMLIRVVSVNNFQDGILQRQEEDQFINQILPIFLQNGVIQQNGLKEFAQQVMRRREFKNIDEILTGGSDADARNVARAENQAILWGGVIDLPKEGENHASHLLEHKPYIASIMLLPKEQQPPEENIANMKLHIQRTEVMSAQPAGAQQGTPVEQAAGTEGEAMGDLMGAQEGAAENMAPPDTITPVGRPTDVEAMGTI